jgi:DNA-binding NtrC family response regulator
MPENIPPQTSDRRILIIDDEASVQESLKIILAYHGYFVSIASTGAEGIDRLKSQHFDLLILDLKMPDQDGFEVLKWVRKAFPTLKVIIITGFGTLDIARNALALGAINYFDKPIDIERFMRKIKSALSKPMPT